MPSGSVTPASGTAFNGGTIANELVVNTGSGTGQALELQGTRTSQNDVFRIDYPHTLFEVDSDGVVLVSSDDQLGVTFRGTGGTASVFTVTESGHADVVETGIHSQFGLTVTRSGAADGGIAVNDEGTTIFSAGTFTGGGILTAPPAPATTTFASGTGKQVVTTQDVRLYAPVTFNPTAGAAATCAVAVSPDNVTYTTLWTETEPAGVALDGTIHGLNVYVPAAWYVKLTATNATIGTATYY